MRILPSLLLSASMAFVSQNAGAELVINELMQSNIDCIMDDLNEFPDSWIELYNNGATAINLSAYSVSDKPDSGSAYVLPSVNVAARGRVVIYCDKVGEGYHAPFRLDSGKGAAVYLFKGPELVDKVEGLKKQPAPNISYGRVTDAADIWGYQATPTPKASNCGKVCKDILGDPVFSQPGRVSSAPLQLTLSLPDATPAGTVIRYTTDGTEPIASSALYTSPISVVKTTTVRAKLFCDGYLSPRSLTQSYIFLGREMSMPVVSMVTDRDYFYSRSLGIYNEYNNGEVNGNSHRNDWRRPVNLEIFWREGDGSVINQLCETRVKGGASRSEKLKSLVVYANKRFGTKRLAYEFFPEDAAGKTDWKSIELRNSGNDFNYLYFRDALIQRNMGRNADLDWQPYQPAIFMLNGEYKGMLNLRTRTNEDYIYTMYDGEEDIDIIENWNELKEGTWDNFNEFTAFYSGSGHTYEEFERWMDTGEFANLMVMNLFHNNLDFPGNNIVMWRRRAADNGRWRWIAKDTDFGLGLYGRAYDYKIFNWLYDNSYDWGNAWANRPEHTRLFRRLMEVPEFRDMFIDRCAVYMGDFLNGRTLGKELDEMSAAIRSEFANHCKLFQGWRPNYDDELRNTKAWANNRTTFFYSHLADFYKLGTPRIVKIDAGRTDDVALTVNGIPLQGRSFDGKYFQGRTLTVEAAPADPSAVVKRWRVSLGGDIKEYQGDKLSLVIPAVSTVTIESLIDQSGIGDIIADTCHDSIDPSVPVDIYNLGGTLVLSGIAAGDVDGTLPAGIYVMRQGRIAVKLVVK